MKKNPIKKRSSETTWAAAYEACDRLFLEDAQFPTVDKVVRKIGISNRRVVSDALKRWRSDLVERFRKQNGGTGKRVPEAVYAFWRQAIEEAARLFDTERRQWAVERATLTERIRELERRLSEAEATHAMMTARLDRFVDTLERYEAWQEQKQSLERDMARLRAELKRYQGMEHIQTVLGRLSDIKRSVNQILKSLDTKPFKRELVNWHKLVCNEVRLHFDDSGNYWLEVFILYAHPESVRFQRALRQALEQTLAKQGYPDDVQVTCEYPA